MKKWEKEITNSKGLTFYFHFKPLARTLEISCKNASGLAFVSEVENVTKSLNLESQESAPMGMVYKCNSYKKFEEVVEAVAAT